jgi:hypothetical protein
MAPQHVPLRQHAHQLTLRVHHRRAADVARQQGAHGVPARSLVTMSASDAREYEQATRRAQERHLVRQDQHVCRHDLTHAQERNDKCQRLRAALRAQRAAPTWPTVGALCHVMPLPAPALASPCG